MRLDGWIFGSSAAAIDPSAIAEARRLDELGHRFRLLGWTEDEVERAIEDARRRASAGMRRSLDVLAETLADARTGRRPFR
jgi:hypothetical protein